MAGDVRVAVVDDDCFVLRGTVGALADDPRLAVKGFTPAEALAVPDWSAYDVALVDATDPRDDRDHYVGVSVVEAIRARPGGAAVTVVVVTHYTVLDALRRRMREAGADLFFARTDFRGPEDLVDVVVDPARYAHRTVPPPRDEEALRRLGVVDATRVNEALRAADELGLADGSAQRAAYRERTRRKQAFAARARLRAMNRNGTVPDRNQDAPSFGQIDAFLAWARRTDRDGHP